MQDRERYSLDSSYDSFIITQQNAETRDQWARSLIVEGIDESQTSVLLLLVTNKAKGGGDIEYKHVDSVNRRVLLTFKDKHVAEHFLASGSIPLLGTNFAVSRPRLIVEEEEQSSVTVSSVKRDDSWEQISPMAEESGTPVCFSVPSTESNNTGHDPVGESARVVFVSDVPGVLTEEKLKNLLESNGLADAEEIQRVEFRRDTKVAKITLFDAKVAAKICRQQTVNFKDKVLRFSFEPKEDADDNVFDIDGAFDALTVTGVNESVSDEMLRMYFENPTRSGGGPVSDITPLKSGECVVKFQDSKVASRVFHRKQHQLDGVSFNVLPLEKVEETKCCAIEVEGLGKAHSEDLLRLYFEHQKFGDATVEDVIIDRLRGKAVVTFKHPQDVEKVLSHNTHILSNVPLTLSRLDPSPPAPLLLEQSEDKRLLATGLPPRTNLSDLRKYFGKLSGVRLTAAYMMNPSKYLLEFEAAPDYKQLKELVHAKPFRGVMISIRKVPLATSIEVHGVCDLSDEILTLFFENRQNGKGKVVEIKRQPDQGRTFIKFEKPDAIPGLLKKTLKLEGRTLKVCWHHSFLDVGSIPLEEGTIGRKKSDSFASLPTMRNRVLSEPSIGVHAKVINQSASIRPSMMLFEEGDGDITPTASLVDLTAPEKMENIKPYHNRLLMLIGFEEQLMSDVGMTQTKITLDEVSLFGSEESRANVKIKVLEKLISVVGKIQHVSDVKDKLMRRDAVQEYIHGICQQRDIRATLASDPSLQVCAFDEQEITKLEGILPSLIKELEISLDVSDAAAVSLSEELKKRPEEMEFVIDLVQKMIRLACLDKEEVQIRELVEKFTKENSRSEKRVPLNEQRKDYIWQHRTKDLDSIRHELEKSGGSLEYEAGAVILKGDRTSVDSASTRLQEIAGSLVEKSYTVNHPGGETFLTKTAPGKLILKGIESEDKAVVTVRSRAPRTLSTNREHPTEPDIVTSSAVGASSSDSIMSRITNDGGIVVTILTGTVESQNVNAIVNSTSRDLILDRGEISKAVLAAAGSSIQDECKRKASSIEFGEAIKTGSYKLPSKCVYHGAAMEWDGAKGRSLQALKSFIRNCLLLANTDGLRSIAFPAIGSGTLKIPADIVVKSLFEEVETFSRQHPASSLKDIRFVIFAQNQHVTAAFKSKLESLRSSGSCWKKFVRQPLKPNHTKTSLTILASSEKATSDVFKKIEDILRDQTAEDRIDSSSDKEAINFLINDQIRKIEELQSIHSVGISLEPSPPSSHVLLIKGTQKDVASVGRIVRQIIYNNL